ncbi:hypothetical protein N7520_005706 [Penicillium odoratum]|uniref:uncharacterized protein n=1 Tax=Penicillium odoratum TaxID=1167516 RepID=UPI0025469A70|nr:uncharacterized protein N7520_005706 [Penicillium odoratum]KAJ5758550.1 hypothetical protein N7520_005706 [Penicillium odoratum]
MDQPYGPIPIECLFVPKKLYSRYMVTHAVKRRITSSALSSSAVKGLEELILQNVRWSIQASSADRHILDLMSLGTSGINLTGHMPTILKSRLDQICFPSLVKGVQELFDLSAAQSMWRVAQDPSTLPNRDLFSALLDARDPETGILIVTGSDTTATTITATLFYLLHNKQQYARVQPEVDNAFSGISTTDVEAIRISPALNSCSFLFACINESMRLSPPLGGILPREVLAGGLEVDGGRYYVPAGTDVGVPTYALHHTAEYWPEPYEFRPER